MQKPRAWSLFLFYVGSLVFTYLLLVIMGIGLAVMGMQSSGADATELMFTGILVAGMTVPLMLGFGAAPFLPRRKWAWVYSIILIGMGMGSCWMPLSIYLLIKWVEPEVKDFYNA